MTSSEEKDLLARVGVTVGIPAAVVLLGVLLGICSGCSVGWQATCSDLAIVEASVARAQGHEVRIVAGRTAEGGLHATGQAWDDGEWRDLRFWNGGVSIRYGAREVTEPIRAYTLPEYVAKRRKILADVK